MTTKHIAHRVTRKVSRATAIALLVSLAACSSDSSDDDNDDNGDGIFGTGIIVNGTVSTQYALSQDSVEFKRQSGEKGTETLRSNSTFAASEMQGTGAVLLRTTTSTGNSLYALALPNANTEITQNIHSYSDLVARNWFASNGQDINAVFTGTSALTAVPTSAELRKLQDNVSQIYVGVQNDYNFQGANIFSDQYAADGTGIDEFLESNPVIINNGVINIYFIDPSTNTQSLVTSDLNVDSSLLISDTENPSTPNEIRALPAATNEIIVLWDPALDNIAVSRYDVYRDGALLESTPYPVFSDKSITSGIEYSYFVIAVDSSGNQSSASTAVTAQTLAIPDTTPPTAPTNLMLVPAVGSIAVSWAQADDDVASFTVSRSQGTGALTEYLLVTSPSMADLNVVNGTQYCYQVTAVDGSGNRSMPSEASCAIAGGEVVNSVPVAPVNNNTDTPITVGIGTDGVYTFGTCGAEISAIASSSDIDVPARLMQGQVAESSVGGAPDQAIHYWSFDVAPGEYALVLEGITTQGDRTPNIILDAVEIDDRGIEQGDIFNFNEIDPNRLRAFVPVTVDATGFYIKISGRDSTSQDYQIALYSIDDVIPTPFLADCPEVTTTSVGTTEAFTLKANENRFFLVDLPAGEYDLFIDTSLVDGSTTNIIYWIDAYALTNSVSTEQRLARVNEVDSTWRAAVKITRDVGGPLYLRLHKSIKDYNIELTISRL